MFNFNFDEANPLPVISNIFGLPEPPVPHPYELEPLPFSPPPYFSDLYFPPTTPKRVISTQPSKSPLGLFHNTLQSVSASNDLFNPPLSPQVPQPPAVPAPIVPLPNPLIERTPPPSKSPFASPATGTSPLPFPSPTGHFELPTTHATRNPHLPVQQGRTHASISTAQKATKQLQAKATKEKRALLSKAIQELQVKHEQEIEALARAHLVTTEYINKLIALPQFKTKRNVNLENAKIHAKSSEVNAGV